MSAPTQALTQALTEAPATAVGEPAETAQEFTTGRATDLPILVGIQLTGLSASLTAGAHGGPAGAAVVALAWGAVGVGYAMRGGPR